MIVSNKKEPLFLFGGDVVLFYFSLWLMLLIRYVEIPSETRLIDHLVPFSFLFIVWIAVFYIAGLYEKHTIVLKSKLPRIIFYAQFINVGLAVFFFYFVPLFEITPKTNLFIYLVLSFGLILLWRIYGHKLFAGRHRQNAFLIGSGEEMKELEYEVNTNSRYDFRFISSLDANELDSLDFQSEIIGRVYGEEVHVIAIDLNHKRVEPILPHLYNLIFSNIRFIDMHKVYEDIFDRVPLSLIKYNWFLENISLAPKFSYDLLKRLMDIAIALSLGIVSFVVYPFVFIALKLEDGGPLFISQTRVGKNNHEIHIIKFRSMTSDDKGEEGRKKNNRITKTGAFIRKTRIDELPQLWNVVRGDISLIGPRPELPILVKQYEEGVPYYNVRHLIKPGLSGWAQLYHTTPPKRDFDPQETKKKLSYDLYYIKNRSLLLDVKIALKTLKTFISRSGR